MSRTASLLHLPVDRSERRADTRVLTILRIAKLTTADGEELCMIRNIAAGGAKLRVYSDRTVGERVMLELRCGSSVPAVIRWVQQDSVGLAFDETIDAETVLGNAPADTAMPPRPPRIAARTTAQLTIGGMILPVVVADLSQGGAKIRVDHPLPGGSEASLTITGLGTKKVEIKWQKPDQAGLAFVAPLSVVELAAWTNARRASA